MKKDRQTLIDERALEVGADSIEVERQDGREWIYAFHGNTGIRIGSVDAADSMLLLEDIDDLKKSKRATLGGAPYRINWNPASVDTGASRTRTATSKRAR